MKVVVRRGAYAALLVSLGFAVLEFAAGPAGAAPGLAGTEAVCRNAFGDSGPHLRPVADAAPGQVTPVGITWKKEAWSGDRLTEILTCASIDGRLAPELTTRESGPDNDGASTVSLTMPVDRVGSVVCGQSLLVGTADGAPSTSKATPFCFRVVAPLAAPAPAQAPAAAPRKGAAAAPTPPAPDDAKVLGEAVTRQSPPVPAPSTAAGGAPAPGLARTGSADRWWTAAAGLLLALGGLAVLLGAPAVRVRAARLR
jgi:hypothetical protein